MAETTELRVYNTMTQQKEIFKPVVDGKVSMYACGVNAYDLSHLGHARAAVCFDVLYRFVLFLNHLSCLISFYSGRQRFIYLFFSYDRSFSLRFAVWERIFFFNFILIPGAGLA